MMVTPSRDVRCLSCASASVSTEVAGEDGNRLPLLAEGRVADFFVQTGQEGG